MGFPTTLSMNLVGFFKLFYIVVIWSLLFTGYAGGVGNSIAALKVVWMGSRSCRWHVEWSPRMDFMDITWYHVHWQSDISLPRRVRVRHGRSATPTKKLYGYRWTWFSRNWDGRQTGTYFMGAVWTFGQRCRWYCIGLDSFRPGGHQTLGNASWLHSWRNVEHYRVRQSQNIHHTNSQWWWNPSEYVLSVKLILIPSLA